MEAAAGVIMRVPGLFIIDYWWQHDRNKSLPHSMEIGEIVNCVLTNLGINVYSIYLYFIVQEKLFGI